MLNGQMWGMSSHWATAFRLETLMHRMAHSNLGARRLLYALRYLGVLPLKQTNATISNQPWRRNCLRRDKASYWRKTSFFVGNNNQQSTWLGVWHLLTIRNIDEHVASDERRPHLGQTFRKGPTLGILSTRSVSNVSSNRGRRLSDGCLVTKALN